MEEKNEILFKLHLEEWAHLRHHQKMRAKVTSMTLAITAGLSAIIAMDRALTPSDSLFAGMLLVLGVMSSVFALKQHERMSFHVERGRAYRDQLEENVEGLNLRALREKARETSKIKHEFLYTRKLQNFWAGLNAIPSVIGLLIMISIFFVSHPNNAVLPLF